MVRYLVRSVSYADEQLSQLSRSLRTTFDARVEDLKDDPYAVGDPHEGTRSYSTTFGEDGIIDARPVAGQWLSSSNNLRILVTKLSRLPGS